MANLLYNGVELPFNFTRGVDSRPAWSEDNKDYLGTDHTFRVQGVVHGADGAEVGAEYQRIRHALETPRGNLRFSVDGYTVYESNEKLDLTGGPFTELVSLDNILGTAAFNVSLVIRTRLWGCPDKLAPLYISNRWTETVNIGPDHLSRITRTGTLVLRANVFADSDAARGIVTPPIPRGFMREEAEYTIQRDGMALVYRFQDVETEAMPPGPAIKIDRATYTESSNDGALRYGQADVALTGRPGGDRKALLGLGVLIATRRMQAAGAVRDKSQGLVFYSFREELHRNRIAVSISARLPNLLNPSLTPKQQRDALGEFLARGGATMKLKDAEKLAAEIATRVCPKLDALAGFGALPFGSRPDSVPDPGLRGTGNLVMLAAALNDPCLEATALKAKPGPSPRAPVPASSTGGTGAVPIAGGSGGGGGGGGGAYFAPRPVPVPPATVAVVDRIAAAVLQGAIEEAPVSASLYTDYRVTCRWEQDEHVAHMAPTAEDELAAVVALGAPTKQLIVEYTAERIGGIPSVPPTDLGRNFVLLKRSSQPAEPKLAPDGRTIIHRTSGWMAFAVLDPSKVVEGGILPAWVVDQLRELRQKAQGPAVQDLERMLALNARSGAGIEDPGLVPWLDANQQQRPQGANQ